MDKKQVIKDFPLYAVTKSGEIFSIGRKWASKGKHGVIYREYILSGADNGRGYKQCHMMKDGKRYVRYIHRLVAEHFIPNPFCKSEVNHIDGDKSNNHISNLEWVTRKENENHAWETNLKHGKPVIRISSNGDIKKYKNHTEAIIDNNLNHTAITDTLQGRQKTAGGYRWVNDN